MSFSQSTLESSIQVDLEAKPFVVAIKDEKKSIKKQENLNISDGGSRVSPKVSSMTDLKNKAVLEKSMKSNTDLEYQPAINIRSPESQAAGSAPSKSDKIFNGCLCDDDGSIIHKKTPGLKSSSTQTESKLDNICLEDQTKADPQENRILGRIHMQPQSSQSQSAATARQSQQALENKKTDASIISSSNTLACGQIKDRNKSDNNDDEKEAQQKKAASVQAEKNGTESLLPGDFVEHGDVEDVFYRNFSNGDKEETEENEVKEDELQLSSSFASSSSLSVLLKRVALKGTARKDSAPHEPGVKDMQIEAENADLKMKLASTTATIEMLKKQVELLQTQLANQSKANLKK